MKKTNKISPEQRVTNTIIELIESNQTESGLNWVKLGSRFQHRQDGKPYNLLNSLILSEEATKSGYKNTQWLTFNQVKKLEGNVKGQKSTYIVLSFPVFEKDDSGKLILNKKGEKQIKTFRNGGCAVFNIEQTGLTPDPKFNFETLELEPLELDSMSKDFISAFPVPISFDGGNKAYYKPSDHSIHLPETEQFTSNGAFLSVLLHEATHSTGHSSWLNRDGINGKHAFGSTGYAFEELVAELGASMLCNKYGIEYKMEFHASYIQSWLKTLNNDAKAIFKASSHAQKAVNEISKYIDVKVDELDIAA